MRWKFDLGTVFSVKFFGCAVSENAASYNTRRQAIGPF